MTDGRMDGRSVGLSVNWSDGRTEALTISHNFFYKKLRDKAELMETILMCSNVMSAVTKI